jgi:hypothetical protein
VDSDSDGLTDAEEPFYQADPNKADTDGDGYQDGAEVKNLFSPASKGKTLDAEEFMQRLPWSGWSFLLPKPWTVMASSGGTYAATITTGSATVFGLRVKDNAAHLPLAQVFGISDTSGMKSFKTKSGLDALQSADGLTTYLSAGDTALQVTYDLNGDASYEYRTSYVMVINSVVLAK